MILSYLHATIERSEFARHVAKLTGEHAALGNEWMVRLDDGMYVWLAAADLAPFIARFLCGDDAEPADYCSECHEHRTACRCYDDDPNAGLPGWPDVSGWDVPGAWKR